MNLYSRYIISHIALSLYEVYMRLTLALYEFSYDNVVRFYVNSVCKYMSFYMFDSPANETTIKTVVKASTCITYVLDVVK